MTASVLLFYIGVFLLAQIALGVFYAIFRKKPAPTSPLGAHSKGASSTPNTGAWPGLRVFKVARRKY